MQEVLVAMGMPFPPFGARSVTSADFVRHFGLWQDRAASDPVIVTHHGRARLVLLGAPRFQDLLDAETGSTDADAEHRLAGLIDRLDAAFVAFDPQRRIVAMNAQAASYFRVRRDAVAGRTPGEDMPDLTRSIARAHLARTLAGGDGIGFDAPSLAHPGEWLRFQCFPFGEGAALLFRNVTAEHGLVRMVDARDALAQALAAHGGTGSATISQRARIVEADAVFAALLGTTPDALAEMRLVDLLAPDRRETAAAVIEAVLGGTTPRAFDSVTAADGRTVRVALSPLRGDLGPDGAAVVMTAGG